MKPTGVELISEERTRQIKKEGWTPEHDDKYHDQLTDAACCYALNQIDREANMISNNSESFIDNYWPWSKFWWKPTPNDRVRELVKAGALIAAEIDRLKRLEL